MPEEQDEREPYYWIPRKIDDNAMIKMLRDGKTMTDCAKHFGCSISAVSKRAKRFKQEITSAVQIQNAHRIVQKELNTMDQLQKINSHAISLLEKAMGEDDGKDKKFNPSVALKSMREIRGQLKLQLELFQCLTDMKAVAEFQKVVLDAIGRVDPDVRREIVQELNNERSIRRSIGKSWM